MVEPTEMIAIIDDRDAYIDGLHAEIRYLKETLAEAIAALHDLGRLIRES